ncbi:MAG TPA: hypothetical protein PLZ51_21720, partial [Aggregatilineales bacterium]|nr:hypothetical protein [Aggregatilineales bacterium]
MTLLLVLGVLSASAQEPSPTPQIELMIGLPPIYDEIREIAHAQIAKFEAETGIKVVIDDDYGGPSYWDRVDSMRGFYDVLYIPQLEYLER